MASELKPCPFCGSNQLSFRSTPDMDTDGKFHRISCNECGASSRATFAMDACPLFYEELSKAWNTRRAAPVEGLETVGYMGKTRMGWVPTFHGTGEPVCPRSQAEEILAAERAEKGSVERIRDFWFNTAHSLSEQIDKLEADNAALTARVKELDRCHEGTIDLCNQKTAQIASLEAKLAAAEKVREAAIELDEAISDDFNIFGAQQKLRAALGGKP